MRRAGRKGVFNYQPTNNKENKLREKGEEESRALYIYKEAGQVISRSEIWQITASAVTISSLKNSVDCALRGA